MEANVLKYYGVYGNYAVLDAIFDEFISGPQGNISQVNQDLFEEWNDWLDEIDLPFYTFVKQRCSNLFLNMKYKDKERVWSELPEGGISDEGGHWGPTPYGTDYGACYFFNGDVGMDPWPPGATPEVVSSSLLVKH